MQPQRRIVAESGQLFPEFAFGLIWPVVAIVGGLLLIAAAFVRRRPGS